MLDHEMMSHAYYSYFAVIFKEKKGKSSQEYKPVRSNKIQRLEDELAKV